MKFLIPMILFVSQAQAIQICGMGGQAMFNSQNVFECVHTLTTCETDDLTAAGYLPSANGQCASPLPERAACGMGISLMRYPNTEMTLPAMNTCESNALLEMGWEYSR